MSTFDDILQCIKDRRISFTFDYYRNIPFLLFDIKGTVLRLTQPGSSPIINPVTFEPHYTAFVFSNIDPLVRLTDKEYNIIITNIEDALGKSIEEISFGLMDHFERKWK